MQELYYPVVDIDLFSMGRKIFINSAKKKKPSFLPNMGHKILKDKALVNLGKKNSKRI